MEKPIIPPPDENGNIPSPFVFQRPERHIHPPPIEPSTEHLDEELRKAVEAGKLQPVVVTPSHLRKICEMLAAKGVLVIAVTHHDGCTDPQNCKDQRVSAGADGLSMKEIKDVIEIITKTMPPDL